MTNMKESGMEELITNYLVEQNGYELANCDKDYDKSYALDKGRLLRFLSATQPDVVEMLKLTTSERELQKFLNRVQGEITKRGIIDVLRKGIKCYPVENVIMFYLTPTEQNAQSVENYRKNIFSVMRQVKYSIANPGLALDMCVFINGLPVLTIELKNQLTKQNVDDAVEQYKTDRDPKELLFQFKRCVAHFAVDDVRVKFCTKMEWKPSWFLPFDKGYKDGAGNPPNPAGLASDYFWKEILTKKTLTNIVENYAQVVEEIDKKTKKKKIKQIFPRYHQFDVVEKLLADVRNNGIGHRYLIQHSAGSGKSNSIAWLAHQLMSINKEDSRPLLDSILVVTDRKILDKQIRDTIRQFADERDTVAWAESSGKLQEAISSNKRIIVTTVEKFPFIVDAIGKEHKNNKFAIIIDEAHEGMSGRNAANMNIALSGTSDDIDNEDRINEIIEKRRMLKNASYFAFTATPKNKTLEVFGEPYTDGEEVKHRPFHIYTMKQAIEEGFILDVLKYYTPIESFYKLKKTVEDDPMFDKKKAQKKLRSFVESRSYTIEKKAAMMVEHFHEQVIAKGKVGGKARAMVVTSSIPRCVEYYYAINKCLQQRNSPYKAIVAYSGTYKYLGEADALDCTARNGFSTLSIPDYFEDEPYRILVVADMYQTGFDEPLLHTMYVDKVLTDIKAVQTLSRLNRACPKKYDTCVLDFANKPETIQEAFSRYYKTTILSSETDPNKLHDLVEEMNKYQVFSQNQVDEFVDLYLKNVSRERLDSILDACTAVYKEMSTDAQVTFKSSAKAFCRVYEFLAAILPYGNVAWEKLSIFLNFLIKKLPAPQEEDFSKGILDVIDLDSYRIEKKETIAIQLVDENGEVNPIPVGLGYQQEPEMDELSKIVADFNNRFGDIEWHNKEYVIDRIKEIPDKVAQDKKYRNAMLNSDEQNARLECERAVGKNIQFMMGDNIELFKQYQDNPSLKQWLNDMVFALTYEHYQMVADKK